VARYSPAATFRTAPAEYAANSGAYMDWAVAGPTRKVPAMATRRRYLKVYSPAGSCSKKKLLPLSRTSSY
jgi:hypothetical protein